MNYLYTNVHKKHDPNVGQYSVTKYTHTWSVYILCRFLLWYGLSLSDNNCKHPRACITAICCCTTVCTKSVLDIRMDEKGGLKIWRKSMNIPGLASMWKTPKLIPDRNMSCAYFYHVGGIKNIHPKAVCRI